MTDIYEAWAVKMTTKTGVTVFVSNPIEHLPKLFRYKHEAETLVKQFSRYGIEKIEVVFVGITVAEKEPRKGQK